MAEKKIHPGLKLALELGPVVLFFIAYSRLKDQVFTILGSDYSGFIVVTAAFIPLMILTTGLLWALTGKLSKMQLATVVLVIVMGGFSVWLKDERFFKMKPTIIYGAFAVLLLGGWWFGKPMLKYLLQSALEGLTDRGWLLLSRNWGLFFAALGVANHVMYEMIQAQQMSFDLWLTVKVWGITALSFLFTLTQVPVMLKNGLAVPEEPATDKS